MVRGAQSDRLSETERERALPAVLVAIGAAAYANITAQIALGWAAFAGTHSELAVGLTFALRMLPQLVLGLAGGRLSDRSDRWAIVVLTSLAQIAVALLAGLAWIAAANPSLLAVFAVSAAFGSLDAVRTASTQALVYDLAGPRRALSALARANLTANVVGLVSGLLAGWILSTAGGSVVFASIAGVQAAATATLMTASHVRSRTRATVSAATLRRRNSRRGKSDTTESGGRLLSSDTFRAIAAYAVGTEILAFSAIVLLPAFADLVFGIGPEGLGTFYAVRGAGGVVGLIMISRARPRLGGATLLLVLGALFGVALVVFALSPTVEVAYAAMALVGLSGAALDALNQVLFAEQVPGERRGAAMGLWVAVIGSAPVGHLEIGALAVVIGPVAAQVANGLLLVVLTGALGRSTGFRRLRHGNPVHPIGDGGAVADRRA